MSAQGIENTVKSYQTRVTSVHNTGTRSESTTESHYISTLDSEQSISIAKKKSSRSLLPLLVHPSTKQVLGIMALPGPSSLPNDIIRAGFGIAEQTSTGNYSIVPLYAEQHSGHLTMPSKTSDSYNADLSKMLQAVLFHSILGDTPQVDPQRFFSHYNQTSGRLAALAIHTALGNYAAIQDTPFRIMPGPLSYCGYHVTQSGEIQFIAQVILDHLLTSADHTPVIPFDARVTSVHTVSPTGEISLLPSTMRLEGRDSDFFQRILDEKDGEEAIQQLYTQTGRGQRLFNKLSLLNLIEGAQDLCSKSPVLACLRLQHALEIILALIQLPADQRGALDYKAGYYLLKQVEAQVAKLCILSLEFLKYYESKRLFLNSKNMLINLIHNIKIQLINEPAIQATLEELDLTLLDALLKIKMGFNQCSTLAEQQTFVLARRQELLTEREHTTSHDTAEQNQCLSRFLSQLEQTHGLILRAPPVKPQSALVLLPAAALESQLMPAPVASGLPTKTSLISVQA